MAEEIINRVAQSKLVTFDLEDLYPTGQRKEFDLSQWLYEGFVLREKDFRAHAKNHDWSVFSNCYVAVHCSTDAIIPSWAYMLIASYLQPYAKKVVTGDLESLESHLYLEIINDIDLSGYKDKPVIIKGCTNKPVPKNAYLFLLNKLQPVAKSIMYGEACSSVPLYKKSKI